MALLTIEMDMHVVVLARRIEMAMAKFVFHTIATIFEDMNEMVLPKKGERAEDNGLVNGWNDLF